MKKYVQQYLEKELGYTVCFHERDFLVGESIPANIEAAINHSRRMIMIISRFGWSCVCQAWFLRQANSVVEIAHCNIISEILLMLGGFLMEFHIAHEKVIQGRKKYLIPILLKNVETNKIKDADLRMYVESHTYLDSKYKVNWCQLIATSSVSVWPMYDVLFYTFELQQNMQKRLHYAMPRVPLAKLKPQKNNNNQRESHVATIAKRIGNAKLGRRQTEDELETQEGKHESLETVEIEVNSAEELSEVMNHSEDESEAEDDCRLGNVDTAGTVGGTDLSKKEQKQLRKIEKRIRRALKRKIFKGDPILDSSNEETSPTVSSDSSSQKTCDEISASEQDSFDEGSRFEITADVHQVVSDDQDELEGAVGGVEENVENTEKIALIELEQREMISSDSSSDTQRKVLTWMEKNKGEEAKPRRFRKLRTFQVGEFAPEEIQWGQEESSESDSEGGWDFETGGMPLLPR